MTHLTLAQIAPPPTAAPEPAAPAKETATTKQPGEPVSQQDRQSPFGSTMIMVVLMVMVLYFLMIRPQKKKDKARKDMLAALGKGDHVVSIGGIHGKVVSLDEKTVVMDIGDNGATLKFSRSAISRVAGDDDEEEIK